MLGEEQARETKPSHESLYSLRLKEWAEQIPVIKLSPVWERNILDLVPSELRKRHPRRVKLTIEEIRSIYENDMRNSAIALIVPKAEITEEQRKQSRTFINEKFIKSQSDLFYDFNKQRSIFANKYFLSHSVMKHIISIANSTLPRLIIDLKSYKKIGLYEMTELQDSLTNCINRCAVTIENDYYREIVKVISNYSRFKTNVEKRRFEKLLNCATNFFSQQIVKIMMNTIEELIRELSDYHRQCFPRLSFKLVWNEDRLLIDPPINQVYSMWHCLIDSIENIANNLLKFQEAIQSKEHEKESSQTKIKVALPDWYMEKSHNEIDKIMSEFVGPLENYYDSMIKQFGAVTSSEMKENILDLISKNRNFEVYCVNVKKLNKHYDKANEIIESVEYDIGRLSQTEAKIQLKNHIMKMRNILVNKILMNHIEYNRKICEEFQELKDQMLDIPKEAQALFKLSETISYASKILVEKLENRVKKSIGMLSSMIEITSEMSEEHMNLNAKTINWLAEIKPIFNKSNTLCEAMKSELEDELQRQINKLNIEIETIIPQFQILDDMDDASRVEEYEEHLDILVGHLNKLDQQIERINFEESLFKFPETTFPSVDEIRDILMPVNTLNSSMCEWRRDNSVWLDGPFEYIDSQHVNEKTISYYERFNQLNVNLKAKIKAEMQSSAANKPFKFSGVVDDPDPMQQPAPLKLCWQVLQDVEKFKDYLELIVCMCNPALCERHWIEMSAIYHGEEDFHDLPVDKLITPNAGTTLRKLIALDLNKDIEKYQVISIGANKELELSLRLESMICKWETVDFSIVDSLGSKNLSLMTDKQSRIQKPSNFAYLDEIQILMNEHFVVIREMKVSYFVKPIAAELNKFSVSLVKVGDMIEQWLNIQKEWFDLEPVFRSAGEKVEEERLREAGEMFLQVYDILDVIKNCIIDEPKFRIIAERSFEFLEMLRKADGMLDSVKEIVRNYLQEVRSSYPRFFFLSDSQVMKILFEPVFSKRIKLLLNNCFTGIRSIKIGEGNNCAGIVAIIDDNDQQLSLITKEKALPNSPQLENKTISSFIAIENAINFAVRRSILQSFQDYNDENSLQYPNSSSIMAAICGLRLHWTCKIEEAFLTSNPSEKLIIHHEKQSVFLKIMIEKMRSELSRKRRKTLLSLIIQIRQQQDITKLLINDYEKNPQHKNFNWKAQVRHYWQEDNVKVFILNTKTSYGYEYSVCEKPMINTPLTERCYRSVIESHRNRLYGALFGPAASGKSHCIKSLARTLAILFHIFNCHEKVNNYTYIGNYLKGLLGCSPCWLCFKNLDHLTIQIQSVLTQQISSIRQILTCHSSKILDFQGTQLNVRDSNCCFISSTVSLMNSMKANGSFKLQRLTDSLKILFRPVAMMIPDKRRMIEIELFAAGFVDSAVLAEKIDLLESYAIEQFETIAAYDFSTRMTMSVVKTAGSLKNRYPDEPEDSLLLRAILDVHLPKFNRPDMLVFRNIMENVFPGVSLPPSNYSELIAAMEQVRRVEAQDSRIFCLKIIQMFEMLFMRHSIIVVGPTLAGKSSIIDTLADSLSLLNTRETTNKLPAVESVRLNQAALSSEELFGRYSLNSSGKNYWKDGIFTRNLRSFAQKTHDPENPCCWQWMILDGPLDTFFLEKLSTLLDDNKTLFLTSGESIRMTKTMSIIIETVSIEKASPATISRCGIIYIEEETIGLKGQIKFWIAQHIAMFPIERNSDEIEYLTFLESLLEWSLENCLNFVYNCSNISVTRLSMMTNRNHMVISVLKLFEMFLRDAMGDKGEFPNEMQIAKSPNGSIGSLDRPKLNTSQLFTWSQAALIMAITWGIGGILDHQCRKALDEFCTSIWRNKQDDFVYRNIMKTYDLPLPTEGMIEDHIYVFSGPGNWRHWSDVLKKDSGQWLLDLKIGQLNYVPTMESVRYMNIFEIHLKYRKPFILLGETATGKTVFMRHLLKKKICQTTCLSNFLTLGGNGIAGYSGYQAQQMFLSKLTKLNIGVYGPGKSRLSINFIDDLNISSKENCRDEAAMELIRQYYDSNEWHEVDTDNKIRLSDVMFLGALSKDRCNEWRRKNKWREPRFFRHFNLYNVDGPSRESIFKIFYNILLANLRMNQFNADVSGSVTSMVNATIDLYSSVQQNLKPVPSKFQYQFCLRDVNRVITGCSRIHKESVETKITLIRLWVHEALRVFADRIVDETDADCLFVAIRESVKANFKDSFETVFDHLPKNRNDELTRESFQHLVFSDFMQADSCDGETSQVPGFCNIRKRYEEIVCSREALRNKAMSYLKRYNEFGNAKKLDILIVSGLLEHLLRIARVLGTPGASLLMICFGGCGRKSLTALAAHLEGQNLQELSYRVSSGNLIDPWREDVKKACMSCIAETSGPSFVKDSTFFISNRQIFSSSQQSILSDISSLIKTGQIPNLFTNEERDEIVERSRLLAQNGDRNLEIDSLSVIDYFYNKCQEKLHFVMYFNKADESCLEKNNDSTTTTIFNSIISHCNIDCYESWPEEAFTEIASKFMASIEMDKDVKSKAIVASKYFYNSVENSWGLQKSPKNSNFVNQDLNKRISSKRMPIAAYLHMIELYGSLMAKRQNEIKASRKRYLTGLEKLELAGDEVKEMKSILTSLRPQLEMSAKETEDTMKKIERENISVENATVQVKREETIANRIAEVAGILKEECEADLAVAIPILEDAVAALNTLKPTDITLVKAMKNPPDTVKLVLAAVCVMLNVAPDRSVDPVTGKKSIDYWAPSKRILGDMNFLQSLKDYDKDNIPPSIMQVVNKTYMSDDNFMPHIVVKASSAAEGLCKWVRAMVSYDEVAKVVAPKKEKLAAAEKECNASLEYLNEKRKSLQALYDRLADLNIVLEATLAKKLQLENQVANCTNKLIKAEGLITSLAGEKARWLRSAENLKQSYDFLAGDLLLSCSLVAFLGVKDANEREMYLVDWRHKLEDLSIPNSANSYDFVDSLEMELRINSWHNLGLSNNKFTDGNATIANNSLLWPLFLDPQNQANLWIRQMEAANKLRVVKATNSKWLGEIEAGFNDNVPILVENLEQSKYLETTAIDYLLLNLCPRIQNFSIDNDEINNQTSALRRRSNFRLYFTSRLSLQEASFGPRLYKLMSVINFCLADEALENRLLEIVVSRERPDLQDKFEKSMQESATNKRVLREEEDNILTILSSSSVNIVEDERAIEALDYSKNLSLEIMRREKLARATSCEMNEFRDNYRPLTNYCAALYDTLASLTNLDHMYRFSLDWFTRLYVRSIETSMKSVVLEKRLNYLKSSFTETLHSSVRNALLDNHKLVYSFLLSLKTLVDSEKITREEINLLRETAFIHLKQKANSINIDNDRIIIAQQLSEALPIFHDLPNSFRRDEELWNSYKKNESSLPIPWNNLNDFQQLLIITRLKPEKTVYKVIEIVEKSLKTKLNSLSQYNVTRSFEESSCLIPLLFILPNYHEVRKIVEKFSKTIGYSSKVWSFSLASSEDRDSRILINSTIEKARKDGGWILLENCHLASDDWCADLEKICESLDPSNTVLSFRLWLTSESSKRFPISILQNSIKIHWETPRDDIRDSFLRYYQNEPLDDPNFYNSCLGRNKIFAKLVYSLCFFHTIVRGREKFGNRGWNSPSYEFTDGDLKICLEQLKIFVDESVEEIPTNLDSLRYLVGECFYGGRILDPLDRKLLNTILNDYLDPRIIRATSNYVFGDRYFVPNRSEYQDYMKHINNSMPIGDSPAEIFSLGEDAATVRDERNATDFLRALSLLFVDDDSQKSYCDSDFDERRLIVQDIRRKLHLDESNFKINALEAKEKYPIVYSEPLNILLIEEIELYNKVIEIIHDSIEDIEKTCYEGRAPIFLTFADIERLSKNLVDNEVPAEWIFFMAAENEYLETRRSLSHFIDCLPKRRNFLKYWMKNGHRGTSFWLGGMFRGKKFMSACRLMMARRNSIELARLAVEYEVLKILEDLPLEVLEDHVCLDADGDASHFEDGETDSIEEIRIVGLFLSGARWDTEHSTLLESLPKVHWCRMPAIRLIPRVRSDIERKDSHKQCYRYECPVKNSIAKCTDSQFFGSFTTDFIATVPLDSRDFPAEHWIKRMTTLFCNKDE